MRALGIIVQSPGFNHDFGFQQRLKPFSLQAFVAKLVMEAFDEAVFPRLTGRSKLPPSLAAALAMRLEGARIL
jgi:hypothetical protein